MNKHVSHSRWLLATCAALALQVPQARADIVTTDELIKSTQADAERAKVQAFLERATVAEKLRTLGVDSKATADRVAAMNQEEVHSLAKSIDALPAGGDFSNSEIIIIVLIVILVAVLI